MLLFNLLLRGTIVQLHMFNVQLDLVDAKIEQPKHKGLELLDSGIFDNLIVLMSDAIEELDE